MKKWKAVSIIVPLYNEQENVALLHEAISFLLNNVEEKFEIIYVNDGSTDETLFHLRQLVMLDERVKVVDLARNFGQTAAMAAGIAQSEGQVLVFLDGDLQNDPLDIPRLLAKLAEGYDVVSGWRQHRQDARLKRKLPSWLANRLIARITGLALHDYGCTLKAYRREVFTHIQLYGEMHRLIPAYAALNGATIAELVVTHHPRRFGASKYGLSRVFRVCLDLLIFVFRARFAGKPMYAFGYSALVWAALGIFLLMPVRKLLSRSPYPMPAATGLSSLVCFVASSLCLLLGLQSEQAMRTYYEAQQAVPYIVRDVIIQSVPHASEVADEVIETVKRVTKKSSPGISG
jgi:glycosyltransferase involved in cell wall biosynthesis